MEHVMKWTLPVQMNECGEYYIELNDKILEGSGFKIGDQLEWEDNKDGSFSLKKQVQEPIWLVDMSTKFVNRYAVRAKSAAEAEQKVIVGCNSDIKFKEFSQEWIGSDVVACSQVAEDEYLEQFNHDNDYLKYWSNEQKFTLIND
jgi:hypothetical protein